MARIVPEGVAGKTALQTIWNAVRVRIAQIVLTSYKTDIVGNGSTTSFTINHNIGSRDVFVQVMDKLDYSTVLVDTTRPTVNTAVITFGTAPTSSQTFEVMVIKLGEGTSDIANGNSESF